jgi:hypothetical protein
MIPPLNGGDQPGYAGTWKHTAGHQGRADSQRFATKWLGTVCPGDRLSLSGESPHYGAGRRIERIL